MKKRSYWLNILATLLIVFGFLPATNIAASAATPSFYALDNGKIRFGTGSENSVNATGQLQQPWYFNGSTWYKLTYSSYPLDMQISTGGDGTSNWNINGSSINTQSGNFTLTGLTIDYTNFVQTATVGAGVKGYGKIIAQGNMTVGSNTFLLTNTFELTQSDNFVKITTSVKNTSATTATNTRVWVGTRDDWVGNTDGPTKTKGTLSAANGFTQIANATDRAPALKIYTGSEGVLFYSTNTKANTSINYCCSFTNATNQDPNTSATTLTGDGSYALFMRLNDLAAQASEEFSWYYAAGAIADLNAVINQVAQAAASWSDQTVASTCVVNTAYSDQVTASGTGTITYAVTSGYSLPAGLSLNTSTGAITGTPTTNGVYTFRITSTATSGSTTATATTPDLTITVGTVPTANVATITSPLTQNAAYTSTLSANGYPAPTFAVQTGSLPAGLSLDGSTGVISGTPTTTGSSTFTIRASNALGYVDFSSQTVSVTAAPSFSDSAVNARGTKGMAYTDGVAAVGSPSPTYSVASGSLPNGLSLNTSTGAITGTPTVTGDFSFTITATNTYGSVTTSSLSIQIGSSPVESSAQLPKTGYVGIAYSQVSNVSGFPLPTFALATGTLPPGVTLNTANGTVSGNPTTEGVYTFTITATNWVGSVTTASYQVTIWDKPTFTNLASLGLTINEGASYNVTVTTNGPAPSAFSISTGSLPPGLSLNTSTGAITGTATTNGTYNFKISATNTAGTRESTQVTITVRQLPAISGQSITSTNLLNTAYSSSISATGYPAPTFSVYSGALPTGLSLNTSTGAITGTPSATGTFSFVIRATNSAGTADTSSKSVVIYSTPTATDLTLASPTTVGASYSDGIAYSSYPAATYSVHTGTSLPPGLSLNTTTGAITGTPTTNGSYTFSVDAANTYTSVTSSNLTIIVNQSPVAVDSTIATTVLFGGTYSDAVSVNAYPAPTYSVASGSLPAGITLGSSTGVLSGTTTATGTYNFTISASNGLGTYTFTGLSIQVGTMPTEPSVAPPATGYVGKAYSQSTTVTGFPTPTFSVSSGSVPPGLSLNSSTGAITGTPTTEGVYTFRVDAVNWVGTITTANYQITIWDKPVFTNYASASSNLISGDPFDVTLTTTGPMPTFSVSSGNLPVGLSLNAATGRISGTTSTTGTYTFKISATNTSGTTQSSLATIEVRTMPTITSQSVAGVVFKAGSYSASVSASSYPAPTYSVYSGALPAGLTLNPLTGAITGTPSTTGTYNFTIRATNVAGFADTQTLTILVTSTPTAVDATVIANTMLGDAFSDGVTYDSYPAPTYALHPGDSLPPGIGLVSATGALIGASTQTGTYSFRIDVSTPYATVTSPTLTLNINQSPVAANARIGQRVAIGATYSDGPRADAYPAPSYSVSAGTLPDGLHLNSNTGLISGVTTAFGDFTFDVTATNSYGSYTFTGLSIQVGSIPAEPTVSSPRIGFVGQSYDQATNLTGFPLPIFTVATGTLPDGLSINPVNGHIEGTPTLEGSFQFRIRATNWVGTVVTSSFSISIWEAPKFTNLADLDATLTERDNYSKTVLATGPSPSFAISSGSLPAGLSLDSSTGLISGTASTYGSYTFVISATNPSGSRNSEAVTIDVRHIPNFTDYAVKDVTFVQEAYSDGVAAFAYPAASYRVSSGSLPDGLSIDASTGEITGTPTTVGTYQFQITADNSAGSNHTPTMQILIASTPSPVDARVASDVILGDSLSDGVSYDAYPAPVYTISQGSLPTGLSLNSATGAITGTANETGTFSFKILVSTDFAQSETDVLTINTIQAPVFTNQSVNPLLAINTDFSESVSVDAYPAATFEVGSGSLPDGLSLDAKTGLISGTANKTGDFAFTIVATNRVGSAETQSLSIQVGISPSEPFAAMPENGFVGRSFIKATTVQAFPAPTFALASGALPDGLSLDAVTGSISGTPTVEGVFTFTVKATNWVGEVTTQGYVISVWDAPHVQNVVDLNADINEGQPYSQTLTVTGPDPVFAIASGALPPGLTLDSATGTLSGTVTTYGEYKFTISITNLSGTTVSQEVRILVRSVPKFTNASIDPVVFHSHKFESQVNAVAFPPAVYQVVNGTLPDGISLDPQTGEISGSSTDVGTYNFAIAAVAAGGTTITDPLSIVVTSTPYATDSTVGGQVLLGAAYSDGVRFQCYPAPTYTVASGSLPDGVTLNNVTGELSGTATATGTYRFTIRGTTPYTSSVTPELVINVNQAPVVDDSTVVTITGLGETYSDSVSVKVYPAATYSIASGALPPGISLDPSTGALTGTSTDLGDYTFVIRATNEIGSVDFAETTISVNSAPIPVDTQITPKGLVGASFSDGVSYQAWDAAKYTISKGALPAGLKLSATDGSITGTPTTPGIYKFSITISNSLGSSTLNDTLTIEQATSFGTVNFGNAIMGVAYKATLNADGYPKPSFAVASGSLPSGLTLNAQTGVISGIPQDTGSYDVTFVATNGTPNADRLNQIFIIGEPAAKIVLKASVGKPVDGAAVEVDTQGAAPDADYEVVLHSTPRVLDKGKVNKDGTITSNMDMPTDLEPGWHHLDLNTVYPNGKAFTKKVYFQITATQLLETAPQEVEPTPTEVATALTNDNAFYEKMGIDPSTLVTPEQASEKSKEVSTIVSSLALVSTAAAAAASIASASSAVTASSMLGGATTIPTAPTAPTAPSAPASGGAASGGSTSGSGARTGGGSGSGGGSGGGSGSGGRSGGSGSGGGNSGGGSNSKSDSGNSGGGDDGYGSLEGFLDDYTDERTAWGDRLSIWKLRIFTFMDMLGYNLAFKLSPFSPVAGKIVNDGAYLRAIFGSLSAVPALLAMFLGAMAVESNAIDIYNALNLGIFTVVIALGALDALAGFAGVAVIVALSIAHYGFADAGTGRYLLTMAMLGFAPIILSTTFRKIRRPRMSSVMDVWERVADLAVIGFISALTTISLVKSVGGLAQVTLKLTDQAVSIAALVALLAMIRVALEEIAAGVFTARMEKVNPTSIVEGSVTQEWVSLFFKYAVLCYMIAPLVGIGWHLWVGSAIIFLPGLISLLRLKLPTSKLIFQLLPGGIASLLAATVLSGWSAALIGMLFKALPNFKELAYVLTPLPVIAMALAGLFAEPVDKWYQKLKFSKPLYLIGGIGIFILTILATGFLSQINA